MSKFSVGYSTKGIQNYINKLGNVIETADSGLSSKLDDIGQRYTKIAKENLKNAFHTQRAGDLLASEIYYKKDLGSVVIVAGMTPDYIEQLYYAEFGAGMVDKSHPLANEIGWAYDVNDHGEIGWAYYTTENDKGLINGDSRIVKAKKNGKLVARTTKSEPTLFMYNTQQQVLRDGYIASLIKDNIEKAYKNRE